MKRKKNYIIWAFVLLAAAASCAKDVNFSPSGSSAGTDPVSPDHRGAVKQVRNVMIMVSGGHNSLSGYLTDDLIEMAEGFVPEGTAAETNAFVVLSRLPVNSFSTTSAPVLYRLYKTETGVVVRDTLRRWTTEDRLFGGTVLHDALLTVRDRIPSKSYGMVLSSHASGWLPPGYYDNPSHFDTMKRGLTSIGQDLDGNVSVEMDLVDFADAIPYNLNYVVLDCCLSGGVEVAWALRGKTDVVAFTQTETMADGFDYKKILERLLKEPVPNPLGVCQDFYNYYMAKTGVNQSATISLVDTRQMEPLAAVCKTLFAKYREPLSRLKVNSAQRYFRYDRHYFYDLRDILVKAGVTAGELQELDQALDACVLYKAATPYFMQGSQYGFAIETHCGLSMYLPSQGTDYLDRYYKTYITWNQATDLVL